MKKQTTAGFTLLEMLAVVTMVGVLAAIAVPNWLGFINRQQLNTATNQIYQAMRQAQSRASQQREAWQVSIRQSPSPTTPDTVEWVVHKANVSPPWGLSEQSANSIQIDDASTTLPTIPGSLVRRMIFNFKGCPVWSANDTCTQAQGLVPTQVILTNTNASFNKRCVIVTSRLGALATGADNGADNDCI